MIENNNKVSWEIIRTLRDETTLNLRQNNLLADFKK